MEPSQLRTGRLPILVGGLLVALTAWLFLAYTHDRAGVWLSAPLDDTFIHFQYAKQLARGHVLQFNDGDSPTTGATSPLYLLLLAPGWLVGFRALNLLIWAWLVNGGLHLLGGLALFTTINRLTHRRPLAYTAMCTYLLGGPLLWGVYSHMEVGVFSTLILLTVMDTVRLDQADADGAPPRRLLMWGCLLAMVRPEGLLMAGGLSLWLMWRHVFALPDLSLRQLGRRAWSGRWLALPLATCVALLLLYLALTGRIATNAAVKSHSRYLQWDRGHYLTTSINWLPMTLQILLEKWPRLIQPLTTLLALSGFAFWAAEGRLRRPGPGALVLGWLVLLILFYSLFIARRDHLDRYYLPYWGLTVVVIWWALGRIADRIGSMDWGPALLTGLFLLVMLPQTHTWAARFGDNCRDLATQHFKVARWLQQHTPVGARIAVNDAGAIPYLSGRYSYDIVGLAHNAFYGRKTLMPHNQSALVWEALEALPHRPDYMVAYPEWIPDIHRLLLFESIERFPVKNRTIVANEVKVVWKLRWDRLVDPDRPPPPAAGPALRLADTLDVADMTSEEQHDYQRQDRGKPEGVVHQQLLEGGRRALVDGGRHVTRGESFVLRATPGKPAILLMRVAGPMPLDVQLLVNDKPAGVWHPRPQFGFGEQPLMIDARLVTDSRLRLHLVSRKPYTPYHYWLMQ